MNFLIDAHLPRRLVYRLREAGHHAVHTRDLPNGNRTGDSDILDIAEREQRVVVTKDEDFVNSFLIVRRPLKLLLISTGNITNRDLEGIFVPNIPAITLALLNHHYVELTRTAVIIHV